MHEGHAGGRPPDPRPRREAGFGGRGRRSRTTGAEAAGGTAPFNRGDRRSLPLRVLSRWRVKGPLRRPRRLDAVPRHHAVRRRERPASPNDVPASRPPLTRRQRSASAPTAAPPRPSPNPLPPLVAGPTMPATPRPNRQPSSMRGRPVQAHNLIGKRYVHTWRWPTMRPCGRRLSNSSTTGRTPSKLLVDQIGRSDLDHSRAQSVHRLCSQLACRIEPANDIVGV